MNTLGRAFRVSLFGESHGHLIGVLVDGVPPGIPFTAADVQPELDRRKPGQSLVTTQRREGDEVQVLTGTYRGRTTGAPLLMLIENDDKESSKYHRLKDTPRPGHSDYPARVRFRGFNDYRGGGMFSGRLTACLVAAGVLAQRVLDAEGVEVAAHTVQIGPHRAPGELTVEEIRERVDGNVVRCAVPDAAEEMEAAIMEARSERDSLGGVVECVAEGVPVGLGEPIVDDVESVLAHAVFVIPAAKGVEFGAGFRLAGMRGSESNDPFAWRDGEVVTTKNDMGGILGGLTTGMPLRFRVAFKPTSSIARPQRSVNLETGEEEMIEVKGRHDPCIVPRAVPVVEAVCRVALADLLLRRRADAGSPDPGETPAGLPRQTAPTDEEGGGA